ncbi:MAG: metal ABC transporter ATP-binding protein [Ardenticatenia bacterium]|nr:metal ABC transporter ATP-binding protein [Ardenticatenia bacterium]
MSAITTTLAVECLHVSAGYGTHPVLHQVTFRVAPGEQVAVLGANGAGKSTLLNVVAGVLPLTVGTVCLFGERADRARVSVAYLPQELHVPKRFPVTVFDVVMMGRYRFLRRLRPPARRDRQAVLAALERVHLGHVAARPITALSGGQRRRVFLARALAQEARILLLDEPLQGIDVGSQQVIMETLQRLREQTVTVLVATHSLSLAQQFDRVLFLRAGHLVGDGPPDVLLQPDHLAEIFEFLDDSESSLYEVRPHVSS